MNNSTLLIVPLFFLIVGALMNAPDFFNNTNIGIIVASVMVTFIAAAAASGLFGAITAGVSAVTVAKAGVLTGIWTMFSFISGFFNTIPVFGVILWFILTAVFMIGIVETSGVGGGGT